jgi:FkbM family methyltransferase
MTVPHSPLQEKVGHFVTRIMMTRPIRATAVGRRTYAKMYLFGKHLAERREESLLRQHVRPGMTVVDMGANVGFYTEQFSRLVGPTGKVHAFEPDPFCAELLRDRSRRLRLTNVEVENAALGAQGGQTTLFCSNRDRAENCTHPFNPGVPVEAVQVAVLTLDDYCRNRKIDRIDVVKMDVEGDEVSVLRGMKETMARTPPAWMFIEFSPAHLRGAGSSPEEFWSLLAESGYRFYSIEGRGELRPIRDTSAYTERQAHSFANIWAVHRAQPEPQDGP